MINSKQKEVKTFCLVERYNRMLNFISLDIFASMLFILAGFNLFLNSLIFINLYPAGYFSFKILYVIWVVVGFAIMLLISINILCWITSYYLRKNRLKINSIVQEEIKNATTKPSKRKRR